MATGEDGKPNGNGHGDTTPQLPTKPNGHGFQPGQSGNPAGRPPGIYALNDKLRAEIADFKFVIDGKTLSYWQALLRRSLAEPALAAKIMDKVLVDATPVGGVNINNIQAGTWETVIQEMRDQRAAAEGHPSRVTEDLEG